MVISGPSHRERRTGKRILLAALLLGLMSPAACGSLPGQEQPENTIKLAGHIETTETDLGFQVPGRIASVSVEPGDEVKAGQVVAKLDDQVFRQEVDAAQGRVDAVNAVARPQRLKDAELRQARAALELAKLRLSYATLTSLVGGLVLERSANPGELAAVGTTIITLGDLDNVWFEGYLPERDLGKVSYGQSATITIDGAPGKIKANQPVPLQLILDATDSNTALIVAKYTRTILNDYSRELLQQTLRRLDLPMRLRTPVVIEPRAWLNPNLESKNAFVPGVIAMVVMLVSLMLTAVSVVREREIGTMAQILVSPLSPLEFLSGKTIPFVLISLMDVALVT